MADFVLSTTNKTSVRKLTAPIVDAATFNGIIENILTNNPWGCTPWEGAGVSHDGVEKAAENYTARIVYEDEFGDVLGNASARAPDLAGFNAAKTELLGNEALETAVGGTAVADSGSESYACRLRCHDAGGEVYFVAFTRTSVRISSYENDAIRDAIETWADGVAALA
ncbi:hypothetical protein E2N92_05785 [Methanofollis formosanus]|uniref:Uncharacterized protein n=1 Tax=Methanofollis formosanus TaxID=299308 RepID=A0A8G1A1S6_9EURY|nr:hypothetical protein [Methanofollis formosanus]QYZ78970.1 hypothetical protein E2N92_05785 [Methanofollis formosanus]